MIPDIKKDTIYEIYRFLLWNKTKKTATATGRGKTAAVAREKTAVVIRAVIIIETAATAAEVFRTFKKRTAIVAGATTPIRASTAIKAAITAKEKNATAATRVSRNSSATGFNRGEKYI